MSIAVEKAELAYNANVYPTWENNKQGGSPEWRLKRDRWSERNREIEAQFALDLADEFAADLPAEVAERIFRDAWEAGHSEGYGSVAQHYEDIADFARFVLRSM